MKGSVNTSSFDSVHLSGISYNTKDNPSTATSMAATVGTARAGTTGAFRAAGTSTSLAASWPRALLSLTGNAGNALKQIVLTGAGGRHRLVLELDAGNQEPEAELMKRDMWLEVSFERDLGVGADTKGNDRVQNLGGTVQHVT